MDIVTGVDGPLSGDADTLLAFRFEDDAANGSTPQTDGSSPDTLIDYVRQTGDFTGALETTLVLYPRDLGGLQRVIVVGLGSYQDYTPERLRRVAALGAAKAASLSARRATVDVDALVQGSIGLRGASQAVAEGARLGLYRYDGQKTGGRSENSLEVLTLSTARSDSMETLNASVARAEAYAAGAMLARDLVNLPPNICTPAYLGQQAVEVANASQSLSVEVLEETQIRSLKMGALLGVAQGSAERPRFIVMQHNADQADSLGTVVLVGKGVTFDTGGYSLKPKDGMIGMKADMGGGAAVIGAMKTVATLGVLLHVVGLIPASDNNISAAAYRPQEVLTASNGKTIEIISTDAEGRLLLADALVYAKRFKPDAVVDIATLTGSCVTALGHAAAGLFSIDDCLRDTLMDVGEQLGERVWPLPLFPEYDKALQSQTADVKNSAGRNQGVGTSAAFLRNFVDFPVWSHIDMAGMMLDAEDNPTIPTKGATGFGARLLSGFVERWSAGKAE